MKWEEKTIETKSGPQKIMVCGDWEKWINTSSCSLFNNKLTRFPCGYSSESEKDLFQNMLKNLEGYGAEIQKVKAEIRQILTEEGVKNG